MMREIQEQQTFETINRGEVVRIGRLVRNDQSGEIWVEWEGGRPTIARLVSGLDRMELSKPEYGGREVLLVFTGANAPQPIIMSLLEEPLENMVSLELPELKAERPKDARVDGKRVTIEAEEEIVLKCGSGSITLRKDGKIVIKGTHLLSRASGPIRVKGASVNIN
jgi:hypothetical protein